MRSATVTTTLPAPAGEVFDYLSRVENLPDWATEFARDLIEVDGHHKVRNGLGEFYIRIDADPTSGVIDMHAGPTLKQTAIFPTRVIALTPDMTAYTFTMFQQPGTPDSLFEAQHASLEREFAQIRAHFARP
jgi:uncharacterized protein YndB with AHSA1/START domain